VEEKIQVTAPNLAEGKTAHTLIASQFCCESKPAVGQGQVR